MWTKFKHWLIRKLGGYVAPCYQCNNYKNLFKVIEMPVETIRSMWRLDDPKWICCDNTHNIVEKSVIYDIADQVINGDYIKIEEDDGCIYGELKVVKQSNN